MGVSKTLIDILNELGWGAGKLPPSLFNQTGKMVDDFIPTTALRAAAGSPVKEAFADDKAIWELADGIFGKPVPPPVFVDGVDQVALEAAEAAAAAKKAQFLKNAEVSRNTGTNAAERVLQLLREGKTSKITDEALEGVTLDPVANTAFNEYLYNHYDLPMDAASRAERAAKHMNFGIDDVWYRGSSGDSPAPRTDRLFAAGRPDTAETYINDPLFADEYRWDTRQGIAPLVFKNEPSDVTFKPKMDRTTWYNLKPRDATITTRDGRVIPGQDLFYDPYTTLKTNDVVDLVTDKVDPRASVVFDGIRDYGAGPDPISEVDRIRATSTLPNVRSVNARFDPRLAHLRNLNAGVAGAGVAGAGIAMSPDAAEASEANMNDPRSAARDRLLAGIDAMVSRSSEDKRKIDAYNNRRDLAALENFAFPPSEEMTPEEAILAAMRRGPVPPAPSAALVPEGQTSFTKSLPEMTERQKLYDGQKRFLEMTGVPTEAARWYADKWAGSFDDPSKGLALGIGISDFFGPWNTLNGVNQEEMATLAETGHPYMAGLTGASMVADILPFIGVGSDLVAKLGSKADALRFIDDTTGAVDLSKLPGSTYRALGGLADDAVDAGTVGSKAGAASDAARGAETGVLGAGDNAAGAAAVRPRSGFVGAKDTRGYTPLGDPRARNAVVDFGPSDDFLRLMSEMDAPPSTPTWHLLPDTPAARDDFAKGLARAKDSQGSFGAAVDAYPGDHYANSKVFVADDGKGYFAIAEDGEINAVAAQKGAGLRGLPDTALNVATQNGGRWLSVFDTDVAAKYARSGFKPVARVPFDPDFAPTGWDAAAMAKYNKGQPDVIFMEYDPSFTGGYKPGQAALDDIPVMDYDGAGALMRQRAGQAQLVDFLRVKGADMDLPPAARTAADGVEGVGFVDTDYNTPSPGRPTNDLHARLPRNPDPTASLPKGDRARYLVENRSEIAKYIAEQVKTLNLDPSAKNFYRSDGPLYRAALKAGLTPDEAGRWLKDFTDRVGALSPRTIVTPNIRNATLVMAKEAQGLPLDEVAGVTGRQGMREGMEAMGEQGYPMMLGEGGTHRTTLINGLLNNGEIDIYSNPKPATFAPNVAGNLSGETVDTHAIRDILLLLNDQKPGEVPTGFIRKNFRERYAANPADLRFNWLDDSLESQIIDTPAGRRAAQTEYPVFADIINEAARELGVEPAEAQAMMWFGFGNRTNLGSRPGTLAKTFDDRLKATADLLGITVEEAARKVFRREIPLAALGAGALGLGGISAADLLNERRTV